MFLACGSFNPPTPMHLRMFGAYFSFIFSSRLSMDFASSRKFRLLLLLNEMVTQCLIEINQMRYMEIR